MYYWDIYLCNPCFDPVAQDMAATDTRKFANIKPCIEYQPMIRSDWLIDY